MAISIGILRISIGGKRRKGGGSPTTFDEIMTENGLYIITEDNKYLIHE